jgi:hypothetical protein
MCGTHVITFLHPFTEPTSIFFLREPTFVIPPRPASCGVFAAGAPAPNHHPKPKRSPRCQHLPPSPAASSLLEPPPTTTGGPNEGSTRPRRQHLPLVPGGVLAARAAPDDHGRP